MKEITYRFYGEEDSTVYRITDSEFARMIADHKQGVNYWCSRLEVMLTRNYSELRTPASHVWPDAVLYNPEISEYLALKLVDGKAKYYFIAHFPSGVQYPPVEGHQNEEETKKHLHNFVQIDQYLDEEFNKKKVELLGKKDKIQQLLSGK